MLVQGKEKEKECVVEDIRDKSSHSGEGEPSVEGGSVGSGGADCLGQGEDLRVREVSWDVEDLD